MEQFSYELKIPKDRVAVLIGKDGETKHDIEESTGTTIEVDSKEGVVVVKGEDSLNIFTVREVVKAIARGFNPKVARQLLKQDYSLEILSINDYVKHKNNLVRVKGRIIGRNGKCRETIENLTETNISVYGKSVGVVGRYDHVDIARRALDSLLMGSPHSHVYKWLEKKRRELKSKELSREFEVKEDGAEDISQ
ncbi:MAG: KH domain-containing protein [Candidatus Nanoarchaeia archaeon]